MRRSSFTLIAVAMTWWACPTARAQDDAQPSAVDLARAEGLFKEATVLLEAGQVPEACPKFLESQQLAPGTGVTLYLADCYERIGRVASAWREFRRAERMASEKKDTRATIARTRAEALEPKLATLTVIVPPAVRVPGLTIADNGVALPVSELGKPEPSDPGPHTIVASAPGHRPREAHVTVPSTKGEVSVTLEALIPGEPEPTGAEPPPQAAPAPPPMAVPVTDDAAQRRGSTQRWVGIGVGAAGVIATGVGLAFGLSAKSSLDDSNRSGRCDARDFCTPEGLALRDDASRSAALSTVFVGVGAAALVGGVILYLTAPKSAAAQHAAALMPSPRGFTLAF